jgi:hypothetical protein
MKKQFASKALHCMFFTWYCRIMPGEEREAGHVAHTGEQKIVNIFVRDLSREKKKEAEG